MGRREYINNCVYFFFFFFKERGKIRGIIFKNEKKILLKKKDRDSVLSFRLNRRDKIKK